MMAMKMINQAHVRKGRIRSFVSYCGGLPSPAAANNPLAYKFRYFHGFFFFFVPVKLRTLYLSMEVKLLSYQVLFSWNPAGAVRAGRNPATYRYQGEIVHVDGKFLAIRKVIVTKENEMFLFSMRY